MIYKPSYVFLAKIFSMLIAPYFKFFNFFRKKHDLQSIDVKTILVTEYHRIGDVIIIAPILKSIDQKWNIENGFVTTLHSILSYLHHKLNLLYAGAHF